MSDDILILDPIVPEGDPAFHWELDARNRGQDLSGDGITATAAGGITLGGSSDAPPGLNGSTMFDGVDDRLTSSLAPFDADPITVMGWAKQEANAVFMALWGGQGSTAAPRLGVQAGTDDIEFRVQSNVGSSISQALFSNLVVLNEWFHIGLWYDPATDEARLVFNGVPRGTVTGLTAAYSTPGNFMLGARGSGSASNFWDGPMTRWQVVRRKLSDGEIASDYERGASKAEKRVELDLTPWVGRGGEGIDWGDAAIEQFKAQQTLGEIPVDARTPNRQIRVPLALRDKPEGTFAQIRSQLIAKAALIQDETGTLRRDDPDNAMFADVVNATLTIPDDWLTENRDLGPEAVLLLEALPDFYGHEVDLGRQQDSDGETIHTSTSVAGDVPGRVRVIVESLSANKQRGLLYAIRSRQRGDGTDPMVKEAETFTDLGGGAVVATLAGASGGASNNVIQDTSLSATWDAMCGFGGPYVGPHRVWVRLHDPGATAGEVQLRLKWTVGGQFEVNRAPPTPLVGGYALVDLGEILPRRRIGGHLVSMTIEVKADTAGADLSIDKVYILPTGESYGKITEPAEPPVNGTVIPASSNSQLRTEGYWYLDTGSPPGGVPLVIGGDLPRLPVSGAEGRSVEVFVKITEGDFDTVADAALTAPRVRVLHRPSWLFPPRS